MTSRVSSCSSRVEWPTVRLGEVVRKIGSGATPRGGKEAYRGGATALIRSQNVYNSGFVPEALAFIDDAQADELRGVEVKANDVLLNITGDSVARVCSAPASVLPARVNQHVAIIRPDPELADSGYIRYWLASPAMQAMLHALASAGATRPALTKGMIERLECPLPPLSEQLAIAHVLGTLDDTIELNRQMNQTLEQIAASLFKSWFVDFDPVRAKAAGRQPEGMDAATAALFPDRLVESEIGEIPEGWQPGTLGDISAVRRDVVEPSSVDPETPYIGLEHLPRQSITLGERGTAAGVTSAKTRFCAGDVLFGRLRPYFHKVGVAPVSGLCSTDILVIQPKEPAYFGAVLGHTSSADIIRYADQGSEGTRMPRVSWGYLSRYPIAIPPSGVASAFAVLVQPMIDRIQASIFQNRSLAEIRDTLLPRLLSGELRVPLDVLPAESADMLASDEARLIQSAF